MAAKRRKVFKSRKIETKQEKQDKIYKQVMKDVRKANAKLKSLARHQKVGSWSTKNLKNRLETSKLNVWSSKGRIKTNVKLNLTQLTALSKAVTNFLESKTSTQKGINEVQEKTIKSLRETLSDENRCKLSYEDAQFYYEMFEEDDFNFFADKIGASTLWQLIDDSINNKDTVNEWVSRLESYITLEDLDYRERAIRLYQKYIE